MQTLTPRGMQKLNHCDGDDDDDDERDGDAGDYDDDQGSDQSLEFTQGGGDEVIIVITTISELQ